MWQNQFRFLFLVIDSLQFSIFQNGLFESINTFVNKFIRISPVINTSLFIIYPKKKRKIKERIYQIKQSFTSLILRRKQHYFEKETKKSFQKKMCHQYISLHNASRVSFREKSFFITINHFYVLPDVD